MSVKCLPPYTPLLYRKNWEFAGAYLFFLFLLQTIDCGYSLEQPRRGGSNVYPQSRKIRNTNQNFSAENFQFSKLKKSLFIVWACFRKDICWII